MSTRRKKEKDMKFPKKTKKALVLGAGGFIGGHLVKFLQNKGFWVRGVDLKHHKFFEDDVGADDFVVGDLRDRDVVDDVIDEDVDLVCQLAADMGGAGFVFTGDNDASIMHNSSIINLHVCELMVEKGVENVLYTSSACMYPEEKQMEMHTPFDLKEEDAYPANPDSEYGWEKLFSERVYKAFSRNYDLNVNIARLHNIFGPQGAWRGGREKAPAAICRKVAEAEDGENIEVWGHGEQIRTFLHIDECLEGFERLLTSDFSGPVNIGSDEIIDIDGLVDMVADIAGKDIGKNHVPGPIGVEARSSNNDLIEEKLGWKPQKPLKEGMTELYNWVEKQVEKYGEEEYEDKISKELEFEDD